MFFGSPQISTGVQEIKKLSHTHKEAPDRITMRMWIMVFVSWMVMITEGDAQSESSTGNIKSGRFQVLQLKMYYAQD